MSDDQRQAQKEVNRGALASQVLDNPIYQEAMVIIRADLLSQFEKTSFKQSEERDEIWRRLNNLNKLEDVIKSVMQTGEMGKQTLSLLQRIKR